jgi:hypothetical protein
MPSQDVAGNDRRRDIPITSSFRLVFSALTIRSSHRDVRAVHSRRGYIGKSDERRDTKSSRTFLVHVSGESEDQLNSYDAPGSTVFQVALGRSEPGRLGAMRRSREYFGPDTRMELKLGTIDVVLIADNAGVASSTFSFQASGRDIGSGKRAEEKLDLIRATHVFQRDAQGKMHIFHEHFSIPVAG